MKITEISPNTTWIQGFGACYGKPAVELQPGDIMGWNYGYTSEVINIVSETPTTVTITEQWDSGEGNKKSTTRRFKKSRIVAIVENGKFHVTNFAKISKKLP